MLARSLGLVELRCSAGVELGDRHHWRLSAALDLGWAGEDGEAGGRSSPRGCA